MDKGMGSRDIQKFEDTYNQESILNDIQNVSYD
jgi:hypothetical protein